MAPIPMESGSPLRFDIRKKASRQTSGNVESEKRGEEGTEGGGRGAPHRPAPADWSLRSPGSTGHSGGGLSGGEHECNAPWETQVLIACFRSHSTVSARPRKRLPSPFSCTTAREGAKKGLREGVEEPGPSVPCRTRNCRTTSPLRARSSGRGNRSGAGIRKRRSYSHSAVKFLLSVL